MSTLNDEFEDKSRAVARKFNEALAELEAEGVICPTFPAEVAVGVLATECGGWMLAQGLDRVPKDVLVNHVEELAR